MPRSMSQIMGERRRKLVVPSFKALAERRQKLNLSKAKSKRMTKEMIKRRKSIAGSR